MGIIGINGSDLAKALGVHKSRVSAILKGASGPSLKRAGARARWDAVAEALGVPEEVLMLSTEEALRRLCGEE